MIDHHIKLDDLLADASTHLKDQGMLALAASVEVARDRLAERSEQHSGTRLSEACSEPSQLTLVK